MNERSTPTKPPAHCSTVPVPVTELRIVETASAKTAMASAKENDDVNRRDRPSSWRRRAAASDWSMFVPALWYVSCRRLDPPGGLLWKLSKFLSDGVARFRLFPVAKATSPATAPGVSPNSSWSNSSEPLSVSVSEYCDSAARRGVRPFPVVPGSFRR